MRRYYECSNMHGNMTQTFFLEDLIYRCDPDFLTGFVEGFSLFCFVLLCLFWFCFLMGSIFCFFFLYLKVLLLIYHSQKTLDFFE